MDETISSNTNTMKHDMDPEINAHVHESRGYDKGFTAGTLHANELLNTHLTNLKHKRSVLESENGYVGMDEIMNIQIQIKVIEQMKLLIRTGHYADEFTNEKH